MADNQTLKTKTKMLYGVGDVGNAMVNSAIQFFLLIFYTDGALIAPALASSALLIGKIWDAVNDPLFGWLSDRTSSRFGKRRAYMIFGALPLAVSIVLLWWVPSSLSNAAVFAWIAFTFIFYDSMNTLTSVPYYALTAELTEDYDERSSLTAFRMVLGVPAYLVGAALTPFFVGLFASKQAGYSTIGIIYAVVAALVLWVSAAGLKEREDISQSRSESTPLASFLATFRNRPFVQLIAAYLVANIAFALIQTLLAYFLTYQLGMEGQVPIVMGLLLLTVGLFLFPWKMLSERWNKGPAYALGLAIAGAAVASTFLLPPGPTPAIYLIAFVAGIGFSAQWVFPWAMLPDVVEYDRLESGEHRGGMYYGVWGFTFKLTSALGIALSGWVLQLAGYVPNVPQSTETLRVIRLFFGPIPLVITLVALPLLIRYPITRQIHAQMRQQLEAMASSVGNST
ncbi:MAG: glycoside-pentoside-hexuronide (GPH):cation symporter [Anaerolineae bacterium]|jgi:GPH family glycoside/pentoside/hexuronide:cation symporter